MSCVPFYAYARIYLQYTLYCIDKCAHVRETERTYDRAIAPATRIHAKKNISSAIAFIARIEP